MYLLPAKETNDLLRAKGGQSGGQLLQWAPLLLPHGGRGEHGGEARDIQDKKFEHQFSKPIV